MRAGEPSQPARNCASEAAIVAGGDKVRGGRAAASIQNIGVNSGNAKAATNERNDGLIVVPDDVGIIVDQKEIDCGVAGKGLVAAVKAATADIDVQG